MNGKLQAGVEDEWLVVAFVGQLEVGAVWVDGIPEVGPERQVLGCQKGFALD
jgi:hypothetical protein